MKIIDFTSEYSNSNMLPPDIATDGDTSSEKEVTLSLYQRVKAGDTIYFDHVKVLKQGHNSLISLPDTVAIAAKGMKCVIVK